MIKKYSILFLVFSLLLGCNSENASDCFQKSGDIIQEELSLEDFSQITIFEGVKLVIKQADEQKVVLETGENLINDIRVEVIDNRLVAYNDNSCNLVRDYGLTTLYVSSPNISEIRSSTGFLIKSDGALEYPSLSLLSESFGVPEAETTDGEFDIEVNNTSVNIVSNGIAFFKVSGVTNNLSVVFAAGDSRLEAENLIANNVNINHRGSNDMLVNPQESLKGKLLSTGDVISYSKPAVVEVEELYKGELIYRN
ncbi:head GIN domain-containing protein [Cellulophaga sp. L1A9]|uniref:head GIN domain-containing protein n=1 Tax=Cellulophaga sp. L1A9 TaxID=2686362 RepID=UPI00131B90AE|nr:head GIN domain-containing protein [Cellulophaga sp. L1A9]